MGRVSLVGAGPGAVDLITLRGMRAIQSADIVLFDALIGDDLLSFVSDKAEIINVGKRCGHHVLKQSDINALIYQCTMRASHIVRLKGGDPFIFGRGHEELTYLKSRGVQVDVIPGISSVTSLALLQHVPLTKRKIAQSFWVLTATTRHYSFLEDIKTAVTTSATLVILMGMRKLGEICDLLISEGKNNIPIMVIQNGSLSSQKSVIGGPTNMLTKIVRTEGPGIIIIGEVVRLHPSYIRKEVLKNICV